MTDELLLTPAMGAQAAVLDDRMARFDEAIARRKIARETRYRPAALKGWAKR